LNIKLCTSKLYLFFARNNKVFLGIRSQKVEICSQQTSIQRWNNFNILWGKKGTRRAFHYSSKSFLETKKSQNYKHWGFNQ
jgi:hypothetical protein